MQDLPSALPEEVDYVLVVDRLPGSAPHGDQPSPAERALRHVLAQPALKAAVRAIHDEFERLFLVRFERQWPDGTPLPDSGEGSPIVERLAWRCANALYPFRRLASRTCRRSRKPPVERARVQVIHQSRVHVIPQF
ncbi:MAG: hypothetical protein M3Q23_00555 [Actinomycetota bacterium]|nr:hypothetical protein [Actinomycetota bacterium]